MVENIVGFFLLPIGYKNNFLITSMRAILAGIQEIIFPHFLNIYTRVK